MANTHLNLNSSSTSSSSSSTFLSSTTEFRIAHQNVRSLRKNSDNVFSHFGSLGNLPDILFCTEVWISSNEIDAYHLNNYSMVDGCNNKYSSGGIIAYVKNKISYTSVVNELSSADVMTINLTIFSEPVCIICVYRFNSCSVDVFNNEFSILLQGIKSKNLILIGDFNINIMASYPRSHYVNDYLSMMSSFGFTSLVNTPTRVTKNTSTCIDHVFARTKPFSNLSLSCAAFNFLLSDHHLISLNIRIPGNVETSSSTNNNLKKINFKQLNTLLIEDQWPFLLIDDPSVAMRQFIEHICNKLEESTYKVNPSSKVKEIKPWITDGLVKLINEKTKLLKIFHKHPNNKKLDNRIHRLQARIKLQVISTKQIYYTKKFDQSKKDIKSQWHLVNDLLGRKKKSNTPTEIIDGKGNSVTEDCDIANEFNKYFIEVASALRNDFGCPPVASLTDTLLLSNGMEPTSFFFSPISPFEVCDYIKSLNNSNSHGIDGVSNLIVKIIGTNIAYTLSHIFNNCLKQGVFPDCLKAAIVIPLLKKGNPNILNNYRPISLLSVFSKIFEKCVKARLLLFLNNNNFFSNSQYGFREGRGTEQALIAFCQDILVAINDDDSVATNFIDLTKAFDTVDHELLLYKLWCAGIRGIALNWFRSYLCNRTQIVKVSNKFSSHRTISSGVPQGSVLGPVLFLVYVNSLFSVNFIGNMVGFADDVAINYRSLSQNDIAKHINYDLMVLRKWLDLHFMTLSLKTNVMFFKLSGNNAVNLDIIYHSPICSNYLCRDTAAKFSSCSILCHKIELVNQFKYLGITFDHRLNFKKHIDNVLNYVYGCNRCLFLLRMLCPVSILVNIYYSLIQSKIQYGIVIWGGVYYSNLKPVIVAHKMSIRIICRCNRLMSALPFFRNLDVLPLRYLYVFKVLKMFFVMSGNRSIKITNYNLRNSEHCPLPLKPKKEHILKFFITTAPMLYNKLPSELKNINHTGKFLSAVKVWLLNQDEIESLFMVLT